MLLAFWDDGGWQSLAWAAGVAFGAYLFVMWIAALVWTYRDSVARSRDSFTQTIALILVLVFNLPGLLLYLILRPKETLADQYDRQLEAEALLHELQEQATCPRCRRKIEPDFVSCPYCRTSLRVPCDSCGRPMAPSWVMCAYCGSERMDAPTAPARPAAISTPARAGDPGPAQRSIRPKRASTATYTPPAAPSPATAADSAPDPSA